MPEAAFQKEIEQQVPAEERRERKERQSLEISFINAKEKLDLYAERRAIEEFEKEMEVERKKPMWHVNKYAKRFLWRNGRLAVIADKKRRILSEIRGNEYLEREINTQSDAVHTETRLEIENFHRRIHEDLALNEDEIKEITGSEVVAQTKKLIGEVLSGAMTTASPEFAAAKKELLNSIQKELNINTEDFNSDIKERIEQFTKLYSGLGNVAVENLELKLKLGAFRSMDIHTREEKGNVVNQIIKKLVNVSHRYRPLGYIINPTTVGLGVAVGTAAIRKSGNIVLPFFGGVLTGSAVAAGRAATEADYSRVAVLRRQALEYDAAEGKTPIEKNLEKANYETREAGALLANLQNAADEQSFRRAAAEVMAREEFGAEEAAQLITFKGESRIQASLADMLGAIKQGGGKFLESASVPVIKDKLREEIDQRKTELAAMKVEQDSVYAREKAKKILRDSVIFAGVSSAFVGTGRLLHELGAWDKMAGIFKREFTGAWGAVKEAVGFKMALGHHLRLPENFTASQEHMAILKHALITDKQGHIAGVNRDALPASWQVKEIAEPSRIIQETVTTHTPRLQSLGGHKIGEISRDFWYHDPKFPEHTHTGTELRMNWLQSPKDAGHILVDASSMLGKIAQASEGNLHITPELFAQGHIKLFVSVFRDHIKQPLVFNLDGHGKVLLDLKDPVIKQLFVVHPDGSVDFKGAFGEVAEEVQKMGAVHIRPIATIAGDSSLKQVVLERMIPGEGTIQILPPEVHYDLDIPPIGWNRYENLGIKPGETPLTAAELKQLKEKAKKEEAGKIQELLSQVEKAEEGEKAAAKESIIAILEGELPLQAEKALTLAEVSYSPDAAQEALNLKYEIGGFVDEILQKAEKTVAGLEGVTLKDVDSRTKKVYDALLKLSGEVIEEMKKLNKKSSEYGKSDLFVLQIETEYKKLKLLNALLHKYKGGLLDWAAAQKKSLLQESDSWEALKPLESTLLEIQQLETELEVQDSKFSSDLFSALDQAVQKQSIEAKLAGYKEQAAAADPLTETKKKYGAGMEQEVEGKYISFTPYKPSYDAENPMEYQVVIYDAEKKEWDKEQKTYQIPASIAVNIWVSPESQKLKINISAKATPYSEGVLLNDYKGLYLTLGDKGQLAGEESKPLEVILAEAASVAKAAGEKIAAESAEAEKKIAGSLGKELKIAEVYQFFKNGVLDYWSNLLAKNKYKEVAAALAQAPDKSKAKLGTIFGIGPDELQVQLNDPAAQEGATEAMKAKIDILKKSVDDLVTLSQPEGESASDTVSAMSKNLLEVAENAQPGHFGRVVKFDESAIEHNEMQIFRQNQGGKMVTVGQFHLTEGVAQHVISQAVNSGAGYMKPDFAYYSLDGKQKKTVSQKTYEISLHTAGGKLVTVKIPADSSNLALRGMVKVEFEDGIADEEMPQAVLKVFQILNLGSKLHPVTSEDEKNYQEELKKLKYKDEAAGNGLVGKIIVNPEHITLKEEAETVKKLEKLGLRGIYLQFDGGTFETILEAGHFLSTHERWSHGILTEGMSSYADITKGGAKSVFTRIMTDDSFKSRILYNNKPMIILDNSLFARMDVYAHVSDKYGDLNEYVHSQRVSPEKLVASMKANYSAGNEQMFADSIGLQEFTKYIVCSTETERQKFLAILKSHGYSSFGKSGKPVEQVIITIDSFWKLKESDLVSA